jgi:hypothetical protein
MAASSAAGAGGTYCSGTRPAASRHDARPAARPSGIPAGGVLRDGLRAPEGRACRTGGRAHRDQAACSLNPENSAS